MAPSLVGIVFDICAQNALAIKTKIRVSLNYSHENTGFIFQAYIP